jgi:hypothetical protein
VHGRSIDWDRDRWLKSFACVDDKEQRLAEVCCEDLSDPSHVVLRDW